MQIFPEGKRDLTLCFILVLIQNLSKYFYFFNYNFPDFMEYL